ncbi:unnamed protein product, partial [marine sediment metagenome]
EELLKMKKSIAHLIEEKDTEEDKINEIEKFLSLFKKEIENPTNKIKKGVINILVDKIFIYPNESKTNERKVEIYYNFSKEKGLVDKLSLRV